jgi:hypothetical protein
LVVALCLLAASAAPPAAGAGQASPASLSLAFDSQAAQVGQRLHLTATLSSQSQDPVFGTIAKLALSPGLQLLSANPTSASLGTWSVPQLDPVGSETLALLVQVTAPGTQTASMDVTEGNPFFAGSASASVQVRQNSAPRISKLSMKGSRFHFTLSEPASVSIAIQHTADRHTRFVERRLGSGPQRLRVALAPGKYRATFIPTDELGKQGRARHVSFSL